MVTSSPLAARPTLLAPAIAPLACFPMCLVHPIDHLLLVDAGSGWIGRRTGFERVRRLAEGGTEGEWGKFWEQRDRVGSAK